MDPFDIPPFEPPPDTGEEETKRPADPFDDIFGDDMFSSGVASSTDVTGASLSRDPPGLSSARKGNQLFNLGEDDDQKTADTARDLDDLFGPPPVPADDNSSSSRGADFMMSSGTTGGASLFDDLLDFTSGPGTGPTASLTAGSRDISSNAQNDPLTSKTTTNSDWLFGGDDVIDVSTTETVTEQYPKKTDHGVNLPEVSSMDDQLEATDRDSEVFKPEKTDEESSKSPNLMVTAPSMDLDNPDAVMSLVSTGGGDGSEKSDGEKKGKEFDRDGGKVLTKELKLSVGSDVSDKVDSRTSSTSEMDLDFSILELPGTAHLNFDMSNHKRTLSKKGSISRRKRPTRAAIQTSKLASSEDSIFIDSTEPRQPRSPQADEVEESQEQTTKKREAEATLEESPSRPAKKVAGGMKIPGLLEGLMGSKRFNKNENKLTAETDSSVKPAPPVTTKPAPPAAPVLSLAKATKEEAVNKPSPTPAPRPKPTAMPRVLPAIPNKPLRSVNSQTGSSSSAKNLAEKNPPLASILSKKPVPKPSESPEKTEPSELSAVLKKITDTSSTSSSSSSPVKDTKPTTSSASENETKVVPSPTPSRMLPSVGGAEWKRPSPGQAAAKPEMKKKPPTVLKKPALKSRPEKPAVSEDKPEKKLPLAGRTFNKQPQENKLRENPLFSNKASTDGSRAAPGDAPHDKETTSETKTGNQVEKKSAEKSFDQPDFDSKHNNGVSGSRGSVTSPKKETSKVLDSKTGSKSLFEDDDIPFMDEADSFTSSREVSKESTQTSLFSPLTAASVTKTSELKSKDTKQDTPSPSTVTSTPTTTTVPRKSSVSGMSSVKPPSSTDKTTPSSKTSASPAGNMGRRDSITGSAYNPIGFRSTLGSSESGSESRSRGSSVSSEQKLRGDSVSSTGSDATRRMSDLPQIPSESTTPHDKVEVIMRNKPEKPETKPSWLSEVKKNNLNKAKRPDVPEKSKEAADEANKIIKDQGSLHKVLSTPKSSATTSTKPDAGSDDNKPSPFGVRLRKVDSSRPKSVAEPANNENSSPGVNWRQQMSQKRQSFAPPKELEKPKQQDSTPEWAKASLQRRQRLLDAGVINPDAK